MTPHARLRRLLAAGILTATTALSPAAEAAFAGGDDFNDNSKDPARWGADTSANGTAQLSETNGRLEYTAPANPFVDNAVRPWALNQGSYTQGWFVQMDAHIGFSSPATGSNDGGNISLSVFNAAHAVDVANLQFVDADGQRRIRSTALRNGSTVLFAEGPATASSDVTLRIAYDPVAELLSFLWDANGQAGGLSFDLITSFAIGSGTGDWEMDAGSLFNARIFGASGAIAITSGQLYADNFSAFTDGLAVPEPAALALLGGGIGLLGLARRERR